MKTDLRPLLALFLLLLSPARFFFPLCPGFSFCRLPRALCQLAFFALLLFAPRPCFILQTRLLFTLETGLFLRVSPGLLCRLTPVFFFLLPASHFFSIAPGLLLRFAPGLLFLLQSRLLFGVAPGLFFSVASGFLVRFATHLLLPNRFGTLLLRLFFRLAAQPVLGLLADPFRKCRSICGTSICFFLGFSFHFETGLQFRLHFQRAPRTLLRFGTCPGLFLQSNPLFLDGAPIFAMT